MSMSSSSSPTTSSSPLPSALTAGLFGATAAAAGKATFDSQLVPDLKFLSPAVLTLSFKAFGLVGLVSCNVLMLHFFNKALQASPSSLQASVVTTAANIVVTALYGRFLFGESLGQFWFLGTALIFTGVALIAREEHDRKAKRE